MGIARLFTLGLLAAGVVFLSPKTSVAEIPECVLADEWVTENVDALPRTWTELSEFSKVYRSRIVAALPNEVRVGLWEEHFAIMETNFDWNVEQRAFVDRVIALLPSAHDSRPSEEWRVQFETEAVALFGEDQATLIFADLGASVLPDKAAASDDDDCNCAIDGFLNCGIGTDCYRL